MKRFPKKRLVTAGLTFAVALGTGFLVQYGDAVASRWGVEAPVAGPNARESLDEIALVPVSATLATPSTLSTPVVNAPIKTSASLGDIPTEEITPQFIPVPAPVEEAEALVDCTMNLAAAAKTLAMVELTLSAPCHAEQVLAVHHDNLMFSAMTDAAGDLTVVVPALSSDAFFIAAFDGGEGAIAQTDVPDFVNYDRAVLLWQGDMGVELHALEFGASYGEDGHRWSQSRGDVAGVATGMSGMMTKLGDSSVLLPLMAEVYTFPSGYTSQDGDIALSVEAAVMTENCGQPVSAQTIQIRPTEDALVSTLFMTMPSCEGIGEYVLLKNVLEDLTLAAR